MERSEGGKGADQWRLRDEIREQWQASAEVEVVK